MSASASILVGVPVWRGARFVTETIRTILDQKEVAFRVLIAIDGDDRESSEVCELFVADPRVRLVVHPERLGWVGNTAFLFGAAARERVEYACIQPHDDLMEPGYLAALIERAQNAPAASVVYSDIRIIGSDSVIRIPQVVGSPFQRQLLMLRMHFAAAAYRGLTRVSALARVPPISGNSVGDFAVDTVWCARMATVGDLVRVSRPLYQKRYHSENTHAKWSAWGRDRKLAAWKRHCLDMLAEGLTVAETADQAAALSQAAVRRLFESSPPVAPYRKEVSELGPQGKQKLLAEFLSEAADLASTVRRRV